MCNSGWPTFFELGPAMESYGQGFLYTQFITSHLIETNIFFKLLYFVL